MFLGVFRPSEVARLAPEIRSLSEYLLSVLYTYNRSMSRGTQIDAAEFKFLPILDKKLLEQEKSRKLLGCLMVPGRISAYATCHPSSHCCFGRCNGGKPKGQLELRDLTR